VVVEALQGRWVWSSDEGVRAQLLVGDGAVSPLQHGADLIEGGRWPNHGDEGRMLVEAFADPNEEDLDELSVVDRVPKLAKLIGDGLQPLAVDADLRVTLDGVAELRVKGVDVGVNIVLE
jgi:hypothetical protein